MSCSIATRWGVQCRGDAERCTRPQGLAVASVVQTNGGELSLLEGHWLARSLRSAVRWPYALSSLARNRACSVSQVGNGRARSPGCRALHAAAPSWPRPRTAAAALPPFPLFVSSFRGPAAGPGLWKSWEVVGRGAQAEELGSQLWSRCRGRVTTFCPRGGPRSEAGPPTCSLSLKRWIWCFSTLVTQGNHLL